MSPQQLVSLPAEVFCLHLAPRNLGTKSVMIKCLYKPLHLSQASASASVSSTYISISWRYATITIGCQKAISTQHLSTGIALLTNILSTQDGQHIVQQLLKLLSAQQVVLTALQSVIPLQPTSTILPPRLHWWVDWCQCYHLLPNYNCNYLPSLTTPTTTLPFSMLPLMTNCQLLM